MGIQHVWNILTPFGCRKPLFELQGKTIAIDLSCWVCEAQNIAEYHVQPKMYLRNLYFRTCYLLLMNVGLVFVLEGKAPQLKYDTIASRNEIQFKGAKTKSTTSKAVVGKDRSRFNHVLKSCREMLSYLGLACIIGNGEAEALCAYLNQNKMVDGCVSQDSDCFAYGAEVVYRNFSISQQGAHAGTGGAIDVYDIREATRNINFGRNKIIALALLCGSDYSDGVFGIGKEAAMKLFESVDERDILDYLRSWKTNVQLYDSYHKMLADKNRCTSCGHPGKIGTHNKSGCFECKTSSGCDSSTYKEKRANVKNEVAMRSKAIADSGFPNEKLIEEFLVCKENVSKLDLEWRQPDMINFVKFVRKNLQWEEIYAFEKIFPIFARWIVLNSGAKNRDSSIIPDRIKKVRINKGVACYEIIWKDPKGLYKDIIPQSQLTDSVNLEKLWSTIEPQDIVLKAYPDLVETFEQSKIKPKKTSKRKKKDATNPNELPKTRKKIKKKAAIIESCQPITEYFKKTDDGTHICEEFVNKSLEQSLDMSNFGDEDDLDISNIVEDIINRAPPDYVLNSVSKIRSAAEKVQEKPAMIELSSFFVTDLVENDLFERSMVCNDISSSSSESSDEDSDEKLTNDLDTKEDSFGLDKYVPLFERLKGKV